MYHDHKLLVANRGEIALRILQTAKALGIKTVSIYTKSDATSPHVTAADESVQLDVPTHDGEPSQTGSESSIYLSAERILSVCRENGVTLLHPGYGFLSENANFARKVLEAGITWLGPRPSIIEAMGVKHTARRLAKEAGVRICKGSEGLVVSAEAVLDIAKNVGFPIILKATAGGGGMGMLVCNSEEEAEAKLEQVTRRAKSLFGDDGVFVEKYLGSARHIEVQIFGDGKGDVVHFGERECSIQRRHQKIVEECPSPFLLDKEELRNELCGAAVRLGKSLNYNSAGTVEFIVDDTTGDFYFLEMNTRIQVEHPVTEVTHPGLDIVKLMIDQGLSEREETEGPLANRAQLPGQHKGIHAIEVRVYAENPAKAFAPSPGLLQFVEMAKGRDDCLRVDSWVSTGTEISAHFDPLLCKVIACGPTRNDTISKLQDALSTSKIHGPPNNLEYLRVILTDLTFREGRCTTRFLERLSFMPRALEVVASGIEITVQHLPGRLMGRGMPRSGPMDPMAFQVANILVGNDATTEALEIIVAPGVGCAFLFHQAAVISLTGKSVIVKIDGKKLRMWESIHVPAGKRVEIRDQVVVSKRVGFRAYLAVRGGFPEIPEYLGSKSTSMGLGGYQGRALLPGDQLALGACEPKGNEPLLVLPKEMIPRYRTDQITTIHVLSGPHDDPTYITTDGVSKFYAAKYTFSPSSNRMGIRLEYTEKIEWARPNGGQGGSHPSNILDNAYAFGSININGDTPVILCHEGPDMGGYVCLCTIASAEMWKLGQLEPGSEVQFKRISWKQAIDLGRRNNAWLSMVRVAVRDKNYHTSSSSGALGSEELAECFGGPILGTSSENDPEKPSVILRQAGDSDILVEFGPMELDFNIRALVHAFELKALGLRLDGVKRLSPCIRSTMVHFDPNSLPQQILLNHLLNVLSNLPLSTADMVFPNRRITLPIVPDDPWCQEAIDRYMKTTRDKAVYLPSNVDYLARNNGLKDRSHAIQKLVEAEWLVFGVGFYLGCPFLVPVDPRCRLVGQKMNPSRTYTPRGALGIAGPVAAIYPVDSPGGYQLYGRTLPSWHTWSRGNGFLSLEEPWLLRPFDTVKFEPVDVAEYESLLRQFDCGRNNIEVEPSEFSMTEYNIFVEKILNEVGDFKSGQSKAVLREEERERVLLSAWEEAKRVSVATVNSDGGTPTSSGKTISSPMHATVWKLKVAIGDTIQASDEAVAILESMKTEIPVYPTGTGDNEDDPAASGLVGMKVAGFGKGVREGATVRPGDVLVILE
ncbi:hypothetical protein ONZ45_g16222 [Pleurotus djamor]|nr:hypothetical protein ONZ45_g16222 [Pleurotus djamor]